MTKRPMDIMPPKPRPAHVIREIGIIRPVRPIKLDKAPAKHNNLQAYLGVLLVFIFVFLFQVSNSPKQALPVKEVALYSSSQKIVLGASDKNLDQDNRITKVKIINASDNNETQDLVDLLLQTNFQTVTVENSGQEYNQTVIQYRPGQSESAQILARLITIDKISFEESTSIDPDIDLVLIVSQN